MQRCSQSGSDILVGDFNAHHRFWFGNKGTIHKGSREQKAGEALYDAIRENNLELLTEPGTTTFSMGNPWKSACSTLDLTIVSRAIFDRVRVCRVMDHPPAFNTDRRPIETVINMEPTCDTSLRYLLPTKPEMLAKVKAAIARAVKGLPFSTLDTPEKIDSFYHLIAFTVRGVMNMLAKPRGSSQWPDPTDTPEVNAIRSCLNQAKFALEQGENQDEPFRHHWDKIYHDDMRRFVIMERALRKRSYWVKVHETNGPLKHKRGKLAEKMGNPKLPAQLNSVSVNGETFHTASDMTLVF